MSGSAVRALVALVFNVAVAGGMYWLGGVGAATCWLTFLFLWLFAGLAEMFDSIRSIESKLDAMKSERL